MEELVPGFRFFPTEEELLSFYLHYQLEGKRPDQLHRVIPIMDICQHDPWHLPKLSGELCNGDTEQWFFFTPRQERETRGGRPNRTTASGYWKATGSPGYVYSSDNRVIGVKKSMVFYKGKAPTGRKTIWKMNEYRAIQEEAASTPSSSPIPKLRHEFSLCRVYVISGAFQAFDRRPPGAETRKIMSSEQVHGAAAATAKATNSQITDQVEEETKSFESSSYSGGGDYINIDIDIDIDIDLAEDERNLQMVDGPEPLWEWEQLD